MISEIVSFIILDYNSSTLTEQCVKTIRQHIKHSYEIIIVDNNGRPEEANRLETLASKECRILHCHTNGGFGLGNQLGAHMAHGKYLCFLNSDVELTEDCITPVINFFEDNPKTGCITPRQTKPNNRHARSFRHNPGICHELLGYRIFERINPKKYPARDNMPDTPFAVQQINGSFMLFPTEKFWAIGGFDTNIFLYHEEYDLAMRLQRNNWTCIVYPQTTFLHRHGVTVSNIQTKRNIRRELLISLIYVYRKYHPLPYSFVFQTILFIKHLFRPHRWYLIPILLRGEALSCSLRHLPYRSCIKMSETIKPKE